MSSKIEIKDVFNSPENKLCANLELFYTHNKLIEEKDAKAHFNAQVAQKILSILAAQQQALHNQDSNKATTSSNKKEQERTIICCLENFKVLFKLIINLSDYESSVKVLLHQSTAASILHKIFLSFEKWFDTHKPFNSLDANNCSHTEDEQTGSSTGSENERNFLQEARMRVRWERMFSNFLSTLHSLCFTAESGKSLMGQKFMKAFVRVIHCTHYDVNIRRQAGENVTELIRSCDSNKMILYNTQQNQQQSSSQSAPSVDEPSIQLLSQLASSLITAGDYGLQATLTEILSRINMWNKMPESVLLKIFDVLQPSKNREVYQKISTLFRSIKGDSGFLNDLRLFVNTFNDLTDKSRICPRTVTTLQTKKVVIGKYVQEFKQKEFVDFGVKCISFYIHYPGEKKNEILSIDYQNIRAMKLSYTSGALLLQCNDDLEGLEDEYRADDDEQWISISLTKEELLTIKKYVAPTIQAEREKQKFREELEQQDEPPLPPAPKVSTSPALRTFSGKKDNDGAVPDVLSSVSLLEAKEPSDEIAELQFEEQKEIEESDAQMGEDQLDEEKVKPKSTNKKQAKPKVQRTTRTSTRNKKSKEVNQPEEVEEVNTPKPDKNKAKTIPKKVNKTTKAKTKPPAKKRGEISKTPEQLAGEELEKVLDEEPESPEDELAPVMQNFQSIVNVTKPPSPFTKPILPAPKLKPRRLFTETSELDTTFDDFDLTDTIKKNVFSDKVSPGRRGKKRPITDAVVDSDEENDGESDPSQVISSTPPPALDLPNFSEFGDEGELLQGVMTIMQSAIKKKMETKRRKIETLKRGVIEFMDEKMTELAACSDRDRADLYKNYLEKMEQVKSNISSQAKRMKDSYNKFQKEISSQLAKHSELMTKVDLLQESFKEKLQNLDTRDTINLEKLEKQVKHKLDDVNKQAAELSYPQNDDMSKRLKEVVRALSF